jgi:hypothetical protein
MVIKNSIFALKQIGGSEKTFYETIKLEQEKN